MGSNHPDSTRLKSISLERMHKKHLYLWLQITKENFAPLGNGTF